LTLFLISGVFVINESIKVSAGTEDNVSGWAWSEGLGWISFNSTNINCDADGDGLSGGGDYCPEVGEPVSDYGVNIDPDSGFFSGHAWAGPGGGWLSFNRSETGVSPDGGLILAGIDLSSGDPSCEGQFPVEGWARFLTGTSPESGGWDGWVELSGTVHAGINILNFQGSYSGTDREFRSIQQTSDGGYILGGQAKFAHYPEGDSYDIVVVKTDSEGKVGGEGTWAKRISVVGEIDEYCFSVRQTSPDGGYILAGSEKDVGYYNPFYIFVVKLNSNGELEWAKRYGTSSYDEEAYDIRQTPDDNGYIITGEAGEDGFFILKLYADGEINWHKFYFDIPNFAYANTINYIPGEGYIIGGHADAYGKVFIIKTDLNGLVGPELPGTFAKIYGPSSSYFSEILSIQQTSDGGYIASGGKDHHTLIMKIDSFGNPIWAKRIGGFTGSIQSIEQTSDNGYVAAGRHYNGSDYDVIFIKLSSNGDFSEWIKIFRLSSYWEEAFSIKQTADEGYVLTGVKEDGSFFIKLNKDGEIPNCGYIQDVDFPLYEVNINPEDKDLEYSYYGISKYNLTYDIEFLNFLYDFEELCPMPDYGMVLDVPADDPLNAQFKGWGWGGEETVGWISFNSKNCDTDENGYIDVSCGGNNDSSTPVLSDYKVMADITHPPDAPKNLSETSPTDYCLEEGESLGGIILSWEFSDRDGCDEQKFYQVQVSDDSNFNNIIDDSGKVESEINFYSPPQTTFNFNKTYWWRVKVWDSYGKESTDWGYSSFQTEDHLWPSPNFEMSPALPTEGEKVEFTDTSLCYDSSGNSYECWKDPNNVYHWEFEDTFGDITECFSNINEECEFPDPIEETEYKVYHNYESKGLSYVRLTITEMSGASCSITEPINITEPLPFWKEGAGNKN